MNNTKDQLIKLSELCDYSIECTDSNWTGYVYIPKEDAIPFVSDDIDDLIEQMIEFSENEVD